MPLTTEEEICVKRTTLDSQLKSQNTFETLEGEDKETFIGELRNRILNTGTNYDTNVLHKKGDIVHVNGKIFIVLTDNFNEDNPQINPKFKEVFEANSQARYKPFAFARVNTSNDGSGNLVLTRSYNISHFVIDSGNGVKFFLTTNLGPNVGQYADNYNFLVKTGFGSYDESINKKLYNSDTIYSKLGSESAVNLQVNELKVISTGRYSAGKIPAADYNKVTYNMVVFKNVNDLSDSIIIEF